MILRAAAACAAALLLLASSELLMRVAKGAPPAEPPSRNFRYSHLDIHEPFFRAVPAAGGKTRREARRPESNAQAFEDPKPPEARRVFIVGGSVALPYGDYAAPELAALSRRALPGKKIEIVSCAMAGYDSRRDLLVLREVLGYQPDLVAIFSGNNEYFTESHAYPKLILLAGRLRRFWLFRALQERLGARSGPAALSPEARLARFEENLRAMVREARKGGVPVALCALPANLRSSAPTTGPIFLPLEDRAFFLAWTAWEDGRFAEAALRFKRFSTGDPREAFSHFYRGKALERLDRGAEAAAEYRLAADANDPGERMPPARNDALRRVASEEGAILVDLEAEFASRSPLGVPGREMFRDPCHFYARYYSLVNAVLLQAIYRHDAAKGEAVLAPASEWRTRALDDAERAPGLRGTRSPSRWDLSEIVYSAVAKSFLGPRDALWDEAVNMFMIAAEHDQKILDELTGGDEALRKIFDRPWFSDQKSAPPARLRYQTLIHLGAAYRRLGKLGRALDCFERALAEEPLGYQAALGRAITLERLGRRREARLAMEEVRARRPGLREPGYWLAHWTRGTAASEGTAAARTSRRS